MEVLTTYIGANGKEWEIRLGQDQVIYCNCPAWQFSKHGPKSCKHLVLFKEDKESGYVVEQNYKVVNPIKKVLRKVYL